jgi:hypothetical protein
MALFRVHGIIRQALDKSFGSSGKKLSRRISSSYNDSTDTATTSRMYEMTCGARIGDNSGRMQLIDTNASEVHKIVDLPLPPTDPALQIKSIASH